MILNQQNRSSVDLGAARKFAMRLRKALGLAGRDFNVCFVDDERISALNAIFRGKAYPTDVLSFPWQACKVSEQGPAPLKGSRQGRKHPEPQRLDTGPGREFEGFLGDIVISVEAAERNAAVEGHATRTEIDWLILHGLLHLLGLDHETDHGEMAALEHDLRARLGVNGEKQRLSKPEARGARAAGGHGSGRGFKSGAREA